MVDFSLLLRAGEVVDYHNIAQANTAVSFVILAFSLPAVIFGPIAGAVADRIDRRNLMGAVNAVRAILALTFVLIRPDWPVGIALGSIYAVAFLFGTAGQFFMPAQGASIPALVPREQLTAANGLFNLTFTATQLLGFALLGPVLSQALGVDRLFVATTVIFVVAAALTMTLPSLPLPARVQHGDAVNPIKTVLKDVQEGLVYIRQDRILTKAIAYLTLATTTFMLVAALAPQFVANVVGLPAGQIGYLVAPAGLGVLVGVAIVPTLVRRVPRAVLVDWGFIAGGASLLFLATSRILLELIFPGDEVPIMLEAVIAGALAAVLGVANAFVLVPSQTILQERSHEHIRARVYATFFTVTSVVSFIPIFFAAAAADVFGVVSVLGAVALVLFAVGVVSRLHHERLRRRRLERVRTRHRQGPKPVPPAVGMTAGENSA